MATSPKADISETENFFCIFFFYVSEIYVRFEVFLKKDQSHSFGITEIINCETVIYLNVQKASFHATPPQVTS